MPSVTYHETHSTHRPLGVNRLEDLPDLGGRSVLVRATLELPFAGESDSPSAALRSASLTDTLAYLAARAAAVSVWGDLSRLGEAPDPGHARWVRATVEAVGPNVRLAQWDGPADDAATISRLIASHDAFVNDSFQWSHLPLPSVTVPPAYLPAACGRSLERDLEIGERVLYHPGRPFVAVLGGTEADFRLHGLDGLVLRADQVLVGGALSRSLLSAIGRISELPIPASSEYRAVIGLAGRVQHHIELPSDFIVVLPDGVSRVAPAEPGLAGEIMDIGPATARRFSELVEGAGLVLWSGSLGEVEDSRFRAGTLTVAEHLASRPAGSTIVGGDALTDVLLHEGRLGPAVEVVSATDSLLELLKNGDLPALPPLRDRAVRSPAPPLESPAPQPDPAVR